MNPKWKHAVTFPWDYFRGLRAVAMSGDPEIGTPTVGERYVVLDLQTSQLLFDSGRYFYALAEAFRQAGVGVQLVKHRRFVAYAGRKYFGRTALSLPNVEAAWLQSRKVAPIGRLSDTCPSPSPLIFGDRHVEGADIFPYPMHPKSYVSIHGLKCLEALRRRRTYAPHAHILFSGNFGPKYDRETLDSKFGVVSRAKIIDAVQKDFRANILPQQESYAELRSLLGGAGVPALIINHSKTCPIPNELWLETVSQTDFFLCCPGVSHPFCHNAIEAMSVGTIPIIEFPELFSPPLRDGVNAITFQGLRGLPVAAVRALKLPAERRRQMSQAAISYYEQHLCIRRLAERWIENGANHPIHFPYIPAPIGDDAQQPRGREVLGKPAVSPWRAA